MQLSNWTTTATAAVHSKGTQSPARTQSSKPWPFPGPLHKCFHPKITYPGFYFMKFPMNEADRPRWRWRRPDKEPPSHPLSFCTNHKISQKSLLMKTHALLLHVLSWRRPVGEAAWLLWSWKTYPKEILKLTEQTNLPRALPLSESGGVRRRNKILSPHLQEFSNQPRGTKKQYTNSRCLKTGQSLSLLWEKQGWAQQPGVLHWWMFLQTDKSIGHQSLVSLPKHSGHRKKVFLCFWLIREFFL